MKLYRHLYTTEQGFSVLEVNAKEVTTRNELRCKKLYSFATNDGTTINQAQDIKPKPDVSIAFTDEFTVFDSIPFQPHSIICFVLFESPDLDKFTKMVTVELQRVIDSANDSVNSATKSLIGSVRWHEETKIALQTAKNWQKAQCAL